MAAIRERGNRFHVQVRMSGFPTRTASFPTRRLAERWAKTVEAEMIEGRHFRNVEARRRTLSSAIDRYIENELPKKKDATGRRAHLEWWRQKLGHLKLADITPAVIVEARDKLLREPYTRARPESKRSLHHGKTAPQYVRSKNTVNRSLAHLSHLFTLARREWDWIAVDPFDGVGKFKEGPGRVRFLSEVERDRLLAETAKDPQLHTFTLLALSTAARAGELWNLQWRDIDLKDGRILLRLTKNAQPRTAWAHGEALRMLKEHGRVRRLDNDRVFLSKTGKRYRYAKPFKSACAAAHVKDFTFHGLRHSAATYLAREGATEQQLKAIGGWKSGVVSRYVHLAAEDTRAVLQKMNERILGK
jgi:integrase